MSQAPFSCYPYSVPLASLIFIYFQIQFSWWPSQKLSRITRGFCSPSVIGIFKCPCPDSYLIQCSVFGLRLASLPINYYHSGHPVLKPDSSLALPPCITPQIHLVAQILLFLLFTQSANVNKTSAASLSCGRPVLCPLPSLWVLCAFALKWKRSGSATKQHRFNFPLAK